MMGFLMPVAALSQGWVPKSIPEAHLRFQMPVEPKRLDKKIAMTGAKAYYASCEEGEFAVAYVPVPQQLVPAIKRVFKTDPASPVIHLALTTLVDRMALSLNSHVENSQYGENLGLPAEFATLTGSKGTFYVRAYLSVGYIYIFGGQGSGTQQFFDSVRLPAQLLDGN